MYLADGFPMSRFYCLSVYCPHLPHHSNCSCKAKTLCILCFIYHVMFWDVITHFTEYFEICHFRSTPPYLQFQRASTIWASQCSSSSWASLMAPLLLLALAAAASAQVPPIPPCQSVSRTPTTALTAGMSAKSGMRLSASSLAGSMSD